MMDSKQPVGKDGITVRLIQLILDMTEDQQLSLLNQIEISQAAPGKSGERESARRPYVNTIEFYVKGKACTGISHDISTNGIFIKTDETISIGQTVMLNIPFTNNQKYIRVPAHVVRTTHEGFGVEFLGGGED